MYVERVKPPNVRPRRVCGLWFVICDLYRGDSVRIASLDETDCLRRALFGFRTMTDCDLVGKRS